jgi:TonB-dependent SusC/RagA subfamily outer membrane receptor
MSRWGVRRFGLARWGPTTLALVALAVLGAPAQAQNGEIAGQVTDAVTGQPIEGVQVVIVGTTYRDRSRADGLYNLTDVPPGEHSVRAAIIGYATMTAQVNVAAGITTEVDFALNRAVVSLDAMVVTGQAGEISRREVGNTLSTISSRDFETLPTPTVSEVLQGMASGVAVMDNSGQVGAGKQIRLRGHNSVSQGNTPLVYVDGIRVSEQTMQTADEAGLQSVNPFDNINPADIERVEVIKGAAATTLYGTQASAGVIQIFTKRGSQGAPRWSVAIDQGVNTMGHLGPDKSINPTSLGMSCNLTSDPNFPADTSCPSGGSWIRSGWLQRYNLSVRGGGQTLNYFVSGRYGREEGVIGDQGQDEWSLRGNFGFSPGRTFSLAFNNNYTRRRVNWIPDGNNREGFLLNVMRGRANYTGDDGNGQILDMGLKTSINHFTTGLTTTWDPVPEITTRLNAGIDFAESDYEQDHPWGYWGYPPGRRRDEEYQARTLTLDGAGSWRARLGGAFTSLFSVGGQLYDESRYQLTAQGEEFGAPGEKLVDNAARTEAFETRFRQTNGGFFFQEQIGYKDRLFATVGLRFDGFSTFGEDYGLATYPKASLAYNISDETFWPTWWDGMKLRAAYGQSGRAPGVFDAIKTWDPVSGDEGRPAVTPANLGNPNLGPERSKEWELGFEGALFGGRAGLDFTYYNQRTVDALIPVQQIPSEGFIGSQLENVGKLENSGIEASLNVAVIQNPSFGFNFGVRYGTNDSRVLDLGGLEDIYIGWRQRIRPCTNPDGTPSAEAERQLEYRNKVECPVPGFWHDVVTNDSAPGFTAPGTEPDMQERYLGPSYPTDLLGLTVQFQFGNWLTLDAVGEGQFGHVLSSGVAYQNTRREVWPECYEIRAKWDEAAASGGSSAARAALNAWEKAKCIDSYTSYGMWIDDADFFRLRTLSATVRLPGRLIPGTRSALLLLQARNLFTITDFVGIDPEASEEGGTNEVLLRQEYYNLPPYRSFIVSLRFDF